MSDSLEPATYEPTTQAEREVFRKRFPWWILGALLLFGAATIAFSIISTQRKEEALRSEIKTLEAEHIEPARKRHDALQAKLLRLLNKAAAAPTTTKTLPKSYFDSREGLYFRADTADLNVQVASDRAMADAFPKCANISPMPGYTLERVATVVEREWSKQADTYTKTVRLRVMRDELKKRAQRDIPLLNMVLDAEYVVINTPRSLHRTQGKVDIYVFDLKTEALLMAVSAEHQGRILMGHSSAASAGGRAVSAEVKAFAAADCSIAAQFKATLK